MKRSPLTASANFVLHRYTARSSVRWLSSTPKAQAHNRIFQPIRAPGELDDLLLLSASSRVPLLTFWSASWCPSCKMVLPLVKEMVEEGVGESHGSVGFAEVEYDAPDNAELGMRYMITSIPTLLAFSRQEAQLQTKLTRVEDLKDPEFLRRWIETEAARGGQGGAGGGSIFSGLFGKGS